MLSNWFLKSGTVLLLALLLVVPAAFSTNEDKSIGVKTGEAVNQVRTTSETTYQAVSQEAQETKTEMQKSWDQFAASFQKQWDEAMKNFQAAFQNVSNVVQQEYSKFVATVNQPKKSN